MEQYAELISELLRRIKFLEAENDHIEHYIGQDYNTYLELICSMPKIKKEEIGLKAEKERLENIQKNVNKKRQIYLKKGLVLSAKLALVVILSLVVTFMIYEFNLSMFDVIKAIKASLDIFIPITTGIAITETIIYLFNTRKERKELRGNQLSKVQTEAYDKELELKSCKKMLLEYRKGFDSKRRQINSNNLRINAHQELLMRSVHETKDIIPYILLLIQSDKAPEKSDIMGNNQIIFEKPFSSR